ncbi:hypothetical protein BGZ76_003412 [Entomortierella beljakovae]|nr:hypothetical protein BGZ76_003412 [Entomortierella beljakovae]
MKHNQHQLQQYSIQPQQKQGTQTSNTKSPILQRGDHEQSLYNLKRTSATSNISSDHMNAPHSSFELSHEYHRSHSRQPSHGQSQSQSFGKDQGKNGVHESHYNSSRYNYGVVTQPETSFDFTNSHVRAQAQSRQVPQSRPSHKYSISYEQQQLQQLQQQQQQQQQTAHRELSQKSGSIPSAPSPLPSSAPSSSPSLNRYAVQYSSSSHSTFSAPPPPSRIQPQSKSHSTTPSNGGPIRSNVNPQQMPHPYQQQRPHDSRHPSSHPQTQLQQPHDPNIARPQKSHAQQQQQQHQQQQHEQSRFSFPQSKSTHSHNDPDQFGAYPPHSIPPPPPSSHHSHPQKSYSQTYQPIENNNHMPSSSRPEYYSSQTKLAEAKAQGNESNGVSLEGKQGLRSNSEQVESSQQHNHADVVEINDDQQDGSEMHKCTDCGKIYKHPNCLWKHRWLHSTYWKGATKFLLSKHQQVQLMEAAAILLGMDESRQGDKDPIVSMFSKQRGDFAIGSAYSTSSSASPATSTKSLSASPPPSQGPHHGVNNDIGDSIALVMERTGENNNNLKKDRLDIKVTGMLPPLTSPSSYSPTNIKSAASSSLTSTPPTLAPDDDSLPDVDEDLAMVSPSSHRSSMMSTASSVLATVAAIQMSGSSVVEMGFGMDIDKKPSQPKKGYESKQQLHP